MAAVASEHEIRVLNLRDCWEESESDGRAEEDEGGAASSEADVERMLPVTATTAPRVLTHSIGDSSISSLQVTHGHDAIIYGTERGLVFAGQAVWGTGKGEDARLVFLDE
jgi:hypothetical protein